MSSEFETSIKPNSSEEVAYCERYRIELQRLKNGITLVGIPCQMDSVHWAKIKWEFSEGAYGNFPGSVHFLEHFINKKARPIAHENSLDIHAWTNQLEVGEEISGVANPSVMNYGIWPVLKEIRTALESPLTTVPDIEKSIETEKEVIKAEIKHMTSDHEFQVGKHSRQVIYSQDNPLVDNPTVTGTEEDIDKLNIDILKKVENKILIPKNLLISFYCEGDLKTAKKISGKLSKLFSDFPKESAKKNKIKEKLLEKINPNFIPGETFRQDHGLNNELITTQFVWSFNDKFPSTKYFALEILEKIIDTHLHIYSREHGWGYHTDVNIIHATDNLRFLTMQIDCRKDSQKDFLRSINKILSLSETKIQNAVKNERKRQAATPINIVSRLSWIVYGLKYHDAMINADKIREIMLGVTEKDLKELSDQLQSIKPVTITTGDID